MRRYHEVAKAISDALYLCNPNSNFKQLLERTRKLYKAIADQYDLNLEELKPPPLTWDAPIVGEAEELLKKFENWTKRFC